MMIGSYSWLYIQEFLLVVLREHDGMQAIKPKSAACKANALLVINFCPSSVTFISIRPHGNAQKMLAFLRIQGIL